MPAIEFYRRGTTAHFYTDLEKVTDLEITSTDSSIASTIQASVQPTTTTSIGESNDNLQYNQLHGSNNSTSLSGSQTMVIQTESSSPASIIILGGSSSTSTYQSSTDSNSNISTVESSSSSSGAASKFVHNIYNSNGDEGFMKKRALIWGFLGFSILVAGM
ncbi:hypothetical protein CANARDRAFT_30025 [[Candida] arabinofermentans NRRL YB-2248]|uniref:Uncharacterized protein n=1 Tax=[Candida] arabinofermentans NRRL YB-2248 TaxID=983967 RepID=A0A1E4SVF9_9ASCO|nr:hypothetical protein CANARDRAFT_30025 [[Candida] arabinofermentans NRRL YB-2248]